MTNKYSIILCFFNLVTFVYYVNALLQNNSEISLVHVIFRHGERTPYEFYPTDPYINETFYPTGRGGLTNRGKLMEFKLGSFLLEEYGDFLGDVYTSDSIYVRSTGATRTQMSALLVLAGLWPPNELQKWHSTLLWQPIPIFAKPSESEDLLDPALCKSRKAVVENLYKDPIFYEKSVEPYLETIQYVEKNSGLVIKDLFEIQPFYLGLKTESDIGLVLPKWTDSIFPEPLQSIVSQVYGFYNYHPAVKQINCGYLLQKILNDSFSNINNNLEPKGRKMFLYSGHESTLGYFLNGLNLMKPHIPNYGSAIIIEMLKTQQDYVVQIKYLNNPLDPAIEELQIPNCGNPCPIQKFAELHNYLLPIRSYQEVCNINNIL